MILIDSRETGIIKKLKNKQGIIVQEEFLEVGDILLNKSICIERKTGSDFLSSIRDRRIWVQASNMIQFEKPIICIITGNIWRDFYFSQSKWIQKSYLGTLATLTASFGISVVTFDTEDDYIDYIVQMEKKLCEEKSGERPKPLCRKPESLEDRKENSLACAKSIGIKTAKVCLGKYKTIDDICKISLKELEGILGKKAAENLYELLHK
jgi:DNA excision repair protein ERCC-4